MTLLIASSCLFPYGYAEVEYLFVMPKSQQYLLEDLVIKLQSVVQDECMRDLKLSDNIFSKKFLGIHIPNIGQWFSFNPFGEVIRADQWK